MPITLAEAKQLTQDKLTQHVIDEFRKSAPLDMMPFDNTVLPSGDGKTLTYSYNRVTTFPTAAGRAINTEYVAQEAKTTQFNVNLKPFGGSFELDRVIIQYEKKVVDHIQFQTQQKIKATLALFHDWFINGDSGVSRRGQVYGRARDKFGYAASDRFFQSIKLIRVGKRRDVDLSGAPRARRRTRRVSGWQ
ncbi:MAG: major capsid protein [Burkholderiales bacterium]